MGMGSYILEFKFKEKHWAIDATEEDGSFGHLINHSKCLANVRPKVGCRDGDSPYVFFVASCNIKKDTEILYDYGDQSTESKLYFPWLRH